MSLDMNLNLPDFNQTILANIWEMLRKVRMNAILWFHINVQSF